MSATAKQMMRAFNIDPDGAGVYVSTNGQPPPSNASPIGYAALAPQGCRQNHQPPGDPTYGSPEWMKNIVLTQNQGDHETVAQQLMNNPLFQPDPGSVGCGNVSKNVPLYTADTSGNYQRYDGNLYYVLVADATPIDPSEPDGYYNASAIWVCTQDFDHSLQQYQDALARAALAGSPCQ
jgi:hypothetical protein